MKATFSTPEAKPLASIEALILRHGAAVVGLAYLRAALARRNHPPNASDIWLSDHLRRDIGLGPKTASMRDTGSRRYGGIE